MKKLSLLLSVMLLSICAQSQVYSSTVFSRSGHPIGGAGLCLSSTDPGTTTTACGAGILVSTFTDQTGGSQCVGTGTLTSGVGCSNPGISDGNGNYSFFKPTSGIYWVQVYGNGINTAVTPIVIPTTAANFVDLTSAQTITGLKTFSNSIKFSPVAAPTCLAGFGFVWYDSGANEMRLCSNGGAVATIGAAPFSDALNLVKGAADATKLLRINVSGNTGGVLGTFNTAFTTNKTLTFPDATDTLSGKATTDTYTNKTFDTAGTGNVFKINTTPITAISGTTGTVATTTGAFTASNCVMTNANHDFLDSGSLCGGANYSKLNKQDVVAGAAGDGTDKVIYTYSLPTGTLTAGSCLRISFFTQRTAGAGNPTFKISFGATAVANYAAAIGAGPIQIKATVCNNAGSTVAQWGFSNQLETTSGTNSTTTAPAENTNSGVAIVIKGTFNVAAATSAGGKGWLVELIP